MTGLNRREGPKDSTESGAVPACVWTVGRRESSKVVDESLLRVWVDTYWG